MADEENGVAHLVELGFQKRAPQRGAERTVQTQERECSARDPMALDEHGVARKVRDEVVRFGSRDVVEPKVALDQTTKGGRREILAEIGPNDDQPIRVRVRPMPQHRGIDKLEGCSRAPDTHGNGCARRDCQSWSSRRKADAVTYILYEIVLKSATLKGERVPGRAYAVSHEQPERLVPLSPSGRLHFLMLELRLPFATPVRTHALRNNGADDADKPPMRPESPAASHRAPSLSIALRTRGGVAPLASPRYLSSAAASASSPALVIS